MLRGTRGRCKAAPFHVSGSVGTEVSANRPIDSGNPHPSGNLCPLLHVPDRLARQGLPSGNGAEEAGICGVKRLEVTRLEVHQGWLRAAAKTDPRWAPGHFGQLDIRSAACRAPVELHSFERTDKGRQGNLLPSLDLADSLGFL